MRSSTLALLLALPGACLAQTKGVVVQVRHDGKPVAAANVTVDDGAKRQDVLVDPSSSGEAIVSDVKPGSLKVTVRYRAGGKDATPVTQVFDSKDAGERFTVALPEAAETVGGSAPAGGQTAAPAAAPVKPEPAGGFNPVGLLFALLVGGGAAAGLWYFLKKNPETVGSTLERLGAQIPKAGDEPLADPSVSAAPAPIRPEPPQKIVLDPVAPIQLDTPYAAPKPISLGTATAGEPSLVSEAGIPIPLGEGETVVGREVGLGLSLAGETTVSRRHARLVRAGGAVTLVDEGSTNGTFVNGQRVSGSADLHPGDSVQFGSVRFRYEG